MRDRTDIKVMFVALLMIIALVTASVGVAHAQVSGNRTSNLPDVAPAGINDTISAAELEDLQFFANQSGLSLQTVIDRYAWNDNFALAVSKIREAHPESFTGAEIVDADNAWVAFAGSAPRSALAIINTFKSSHSGVAVEVRTGKGFTEAELQRAIEAAHYAVLNTTEVLDANTSFDFASGQISTIVVLERTSANSTLDGLQAIAVKNLTDATRADIVNNITTSVAHSERSDLGGNDSRTEHRGGEDLIEGRRPDCTSGFGTKTSTGVRGISTAGHCPDDLSDDGISLTLMLEYEGTYGDFQWHTGTGTHTDDFYAGSASATEVNLRDVSFVASPEVGQLLCRNGLTSHRDCQRVRKLNVCSRHRCNLVQMAGRLSADGDSGGPVYLGNSAYGLHQGFVYDPPTSSIKRDVFSRADRMPSALKGVYVASD